MFFVLLLFSLFLVLMTRTVFSAFLGTFIPAHASALTFRTTFTVFSRTFASGTTSGHRMTSAFRTPTSTPTPTPRPTVVFTRTAATTVASRAPTGQRPSTFSASTMASVFLDSFVKLLKILMVLVSIVDQLHWIEHGRHEVCPTTDILV